ncbi:MAG: NAD(P)H-dependent glycerol-3-phosphate dehydrogenase, partial [Bryobacteraceae bacterium]
DRMRSTRVNDIYLPESKIPANVEVFSEIEPAARGANVVLGVMPSHHARRIYGSIRNECQPGMTFVSATKGLEHGTLERISEVIAEETGSARIAVLSGPTFAKEVARGEPAAVVIASRDLEVASEVQAQFSGPTFRLYTNGDPIGVEVGAALKNVIAIGAGVCRGLGLGNNSVAALITRGLAEISRLAVAMGGQPKTLAGLAGLGDLVLTCTGDLSRNRTVGMELGKGRKIEDIVGGMRMVAEGVQTTAVAMELARRHGVDMPITAQMDLVINHGKDPREALRDLMDRSLKGE